MDVSSARFPWGHGGGLHLHVDPGDLVALSVANRFSVLA